MVGAHKELVALFVVLRLLELGLARDRDNPNDEEYEYDDSIDKEGAPAGRERTSAHPRGGHSA
jgi:hypothetical protein